MAATLLPGSLLVACPVAPKRPGAHKQQLQVIEHPQIFASGDCALIETDPRPPSGVWAVQAAIPLAHNLQAACKAQPLRPWRPQRRACSSLGIQAGHPRLGSHRGNPARPPPTALALETTHRPALHAALQPTRMDLQPVPRRSNTLPGLCRHCQQKSSKLFQPVWAAGHGTGRCCRSAVQ